MKPVINVVVLFLFLIIGAGIYSNSLSNPFVYDDEIYVEGNRNIRSLSNIPRFFTNPRLIAATPSQAGHYRPIVVTTYAINYAFGGLKPFGYHVINLLFHIGSAFLVFLIVKAMLNSTPTLTLPRQGGGDKGAVVWLTAPYLAPLVAGLIFLVHPFNSEAVNYITARSSLMSGFFYLLAFWSWVMYRSKKQEVRSKKQEERSQQTEARSKKLEVRNDLTSNLLPLTSGILPLTSYFYLFSLLAFIAGMLSKEVVITLPIMLWLYDLYFKNINPHFLKWRTYIPYIPFILIVTVPYLLVRLSSFGGIFPSSQRSVMTQVYIGTTVIAKYFQMLFLPINLTPIHEMDTYRNLLSFPVLFSAVILLILFAAGLLLYKASSQPLRVVSFFILWFFLVLLPIASVSLNAVFQENRGYLAVVSFAVIAGTLLGGLSRKVLRGGAVFMLIMLVIIYSVLVVKRNIVWGNVVTLWEDTVKKSPGSPMSYTTLGVAYRRNGMNDKAKSMFQKAILLGGERNFIAHDSLGRIYKAEERWEIAEKEFEKAIEIFPNYPLTYNELGTVYTNMGRFELAEEQYNKAIKIDSGDPMPHFNLGALYAKMGRVDDTVNAYKRALHLSPENMHLNMRLKIGILHENIGKREDAANYYRQVLKYSEENNKALYQEARVRLAGLEK